MVKRPPHVRFDVRQRELEIRLERVPRLAAPSPHLEQYHTPPKIAADVLYRALAMGDIQGRRVADLGCGTGVFLVGAALLGAAAVTGVETDPEGVKVARKTLADWSLEGQVEQADVDQFTGSFDTVIMNPPFGAQHAARHADTLFVTRALELAPVAYSLHLLDTAAHLERLARTLSADAERLARYDFPLPHQFDFHSKEKVLVPVALYRFQRMGRG